MSRNILGIFDGGDVEDISALIDKLDKSSFDYMRLEGDGVSIVIGKNGAGATGVGAGAGTAATASAGASAGTAVAGAGATGAANGGSGVGTIEPTAAATVAKPDIAEQEGVIIIRSPNYGLFYAQAEPGSPPYVTIGAVIKAGDTVGLLETMKTFTAVSSPTDGVVAAIHVSNEDVLEPGQPLVSILAGTRE